MDEDGWLEVEYQALRTEILALGAAERDAVKFYVPSSAFVYAVPYYLFGQGYLGTSALKNAPFLWTFVAAVAGLLLLAMLRSVLWSVDGSRRLGMYIMTVIEPRTRGGLRYESMLFRLQQKRRRRPSDAFTIAVSCVISNVVAACGAGVLFMPDEPWFRQFQAMLVALGFLVASIPSILTIRGSRGGRRAYHEHMTELMRKPSAE